MRRKKQKNNNKTPTKRIMGRKKKKTKLEKHMIASQCIGLSVTCICGWSAFSPPFTILCGCGAMCFAMQYFWQINVQIGGLLSKLCIIRVFKHFTQFFLLQISFIPEMRIRYILFVSLIIISDVIAGKHRKHSRKHSLFPDYDNDLSLWIDEPQVKRFSGKCPSSPIRCISEDHFTFPHPSFPRRKSNVFSMQCITGYSLKIYAIDNGRVSMHLKSPNFNKNIPIIPSEVSSVNFTWRAGTKKYYYHFDRLLSLDESILKPPKVSIEDHGDVPKKAKGVFFFWGFWFCFGVKHPINIFVYRI